MQKNEIRRWNKNVRLLEKVEKLAWQRADREKRPIEFFEGLATYLADGLLGCQLSHGDIWTSDPKSGLR